MAGITLEQAEAKLALWLAADEAVSSSQEYSIGDRSLTRADAGEITRKIEYWQNWCVRLSRGASTRMRGGVPS